MIECDVEEVKVVLGKIFLLFLGTLLTHIF
jgi:hypothetical protein